MNGTTLHTWPGTPNGRTHYDIGGDDCSNVAIVYPSEDGDEDTLRKARLITAAPELLEFAEQIFNGHGTGMIQIRDSPADETLANILASGPQGPGQGEGPRTAEYRPCPQDLRRSRLGGGPDEQPRRACDALREAKRMKQLGDGPIDERLRELMTIAWRAISALAP